MKNWILLSCMFFLVSLGGKAQSSSELNTLLPSATLEEAGFNSDSIESLMDYVDEYAYGDFRGLVVIKENKIVLEEYYNTFWRKTIHDIRSAGKSVTAMLLGIAIKEGLIESLDQSIYSLFSETKNSSINEDYKKITLRHVLDMSSGLNADSDNWRTPGHAGQWIGLDNWKDYILNVPIKREPGNGFVYADIHPLLIGLGIEEAAGMSLKDYAQEKLFNPLGIKQVYWYTNEANQTGAAGNLYLTTLDFAKLGVLVANEGKWGNEQIIESDYVEEMINSKNPSIKDWFTVADTYGMFWYKGSRVFGGKTIDYMLASGIGGNYVVVVPEEKLVIAITSSAHRQRYQHRRSYTIMTKVLSALE